MQPEQPLTLADAEVIANPYPIYEKMRSRSPVHLDPTYQIYVVTGAPEMEEIMSRPRDFSSVPDPGVMAIYSDDPEVLELYRHAGAWAPINTLVTTDPPEHGRYRALVDKAVSATSVNRLTETVTSIANELIDSFQEEGRVEFVESYSLKLPLFVLCGLLGLPRTAAATMRELAESTTRLADGRRLTRETLLENHRIQVRGQKVFDEHIDEAAASPAENLLSHLVNVTLDTGERLNRREIHSILQALLVGGNDTTPSGLSNCAVLLAKHADVQSRLRANPGLVGAFVEEAMRLESPVQGQYRRATLDVTVGGVTIPRGAMISLRFGACNRDPRKFDRPDELVLDRKSARSHFAFGTGIHYCVGAILARTELSVSISRMLARLDDIRLDPPDLKIEYVDKIVVRNPASLPLTFVPRRAGDRSATGAP